MPKKKTYIDKYFEVSDLPNSELRQGLNVFLIGLAVFIGAYLNLSPSRMIALVFITYAALYPVKSIIMAKITISLTGASVLFLILEHRQQAEDVAVLVYLSLLLTIFQLVAEHFKLINSKEKD